MFKTLHKAGKASILLRTTHTQCPKNRNSYRPSVKLCCGLHEDCPVKLPQVQCERNHLCCQYGASNSLIIHCAPRVKSSNPEELSIDTEIAHTYLIVGVAAPAVNAVSRLINCSHSD